jgi:hypothetical protein
MAQRIQGWTHYSKEAEETFAAYHEDEDPRKISEKGEQYPSGEPHRRQGSCSDEVAAEGAQAISQFSSPEH